MNEETCDDEVMVDESESNASEIIGIALGGASGSFSVLAHPIVRATIIVTYFAIFTIGVTGNAVVVYIIVRSPNMHTITNMFITNLAISDITMCLLSVPFTPLALFMDTWMFGDLLCHLIPLTMATSVYVSTLTSTAIAVDRYLVIVHPFLSRMRKSICLVIIFLIWCVSVLISLPLAIYQKVSQQPGAPNGTMDCMETWPKDNTRKIFTLCSFVLQFCIPGIIIGFCYSRVNLVLKRRLLAKISRASNAVRTKDIADIRRKRRTNRMLIAMICAFCTAWIGLNALLIAAEFNESIHETKYFLVLFLLAHATATSSTNYNPILYGIMNDTFRDEMREVLGYRLWSVLTCTCFCRKLAKRSNQVRQVKTATSTDHDAGPVSLPRSRNRSRGLATKTDASGTAGSKLANRPRSNSKRQAEENGEEESFLADSSCDSANKRPELEDVYTEIDGDMVITPMRKQYHALPALLFGNGFMQAMTIGIMPNDGSNRLSAKLEQLRKMSVPVTVEVSTTETGTQSTKFCSSNQETRCMSLQPVLSATKRKGCGFTMKEHSEARHTWSNVQCNGNNYLEPTESIPVDREATSETPFAGAKTCNDE